MAEGESSPYEYYGAIPGQAFCENIILAEDSPIQLFNSNEVNESVDMLILENASGTIDTVTFTLLPKITILSIKASNITDIAPNSFETIENLDVLSIAENLSIPPLTKELLSSSTLTSLTIESNKNLQLSTNCFSHLKNLKSLTITEQSIEHLTKDLFQGLTSLRELSLINCNIKKVDIDCFGDLENLDYLNLDYNDIDHIDPEVFVYLDKLMWLILHGNPRINLKKEHLELLQSLEEIALPFDKLVELNSDGTLEVLSGLKKVHLTMQDMERPDYQALLEELRSKNIEVEMVLGNDYLQDGGDEQLVD